MEEDAEDDIYVDLPNFRYDKTLDKLNASIAKLEAENRILQGKLNQVAKEKQVLEVNCGVLSTNISSLLKTAKSEIQRKERTIADLREQLNRVMPAKNRFGLKRRKETIVSPSPLKRSRFSPRKVRRSTVERKVSLPARITEPQSTSAAKTSIRHERSDDGKAPRDGQSRQRCDSGKENAPLTGTEAPKGSPAAHPSPVGTAEDPIPTIAVPSLPMLECPTLFSARMYKRLYGKDHVNSTSPVPGNLMESKEMTPPAIFNEGQKSSNPAPTILASSPGSDNAEDSGTQSPVLVLKPFATSYSVAPKCHGAPPEVTNVVPKSVPELLPEKLETVTNKCRGAPPEVTNVVPKSVPELLPDKLEPVTPKCHGAPPEVTNVVPTSVPELPPEKLEPPLLVEPVPVTRKTPDSCEQVTNEGPVGKSRISGLLTVCKRRIQSPAVRPMQQLAVVDTPAKVSEKNRALEVDPPVTTPGSKQKPADNKPSPDRQLKVPSLPGSVKGRTVRKVFAPISNQWNCSLPPISDQSVGSERGCDEVLSVKALSRTSELTVRVDNSRNEGLKKPLLVEDVFGSPVKWADDSSDSPVAEGLANSRKTIIYSVFGSPLKSLDSNSSDHPFTVPPGAFEDSCWTNQTLDKIPSKSSDGSSRNSKCLEPVGKNPAETCHEPVAEKITETSICPPPLRSVIKKNKSIFSPLKDSRLSVPNDEPSRSNTGIFFPFPRSKYEDSVLGQFDDTAQFVSALAKVDTKISPLSTPVKSEENNTQLQSVIVKNTPTSFEEVFRKNVQTEEAREKSADLGYVGPGSVSNELFECGNPQSVVRPKITITPPKCDNIKLIHRPNFASSTIFEVKSGVKSWFPNAPARMVTPRKTPRLVSSVNRSTSPKGIDMPVSARVAINDAFIVEQEERVRRWELDHLFENTIRSASGSPVKSLNRSPTHKRVDSPGKSPLKRSRKQPSPNKSPRRVEFRRNLGIATSPQLLNPDVSGGSMDNPNTTAAPDNQTDVAKTVDPCQNPPEPIKSLLDTTPKLMDMLSAIMTQIKHAEQRNVGGTGFKSNDSAPKSDAANRDRMVENSEKTPCFDIKTLATSIARNEAGTELDYSKHPGEAEDLRPKIAIDRIPSEATPVAAQTIQTGVLPVERTDEGNLKIPITENAATALPLGQSNEATSLPVPNPATRPAQIVRTGRGEVQRIPLNKGLSTELNPSEPSPSEVDGTKYIDASVKKSFSSKYGSIISRVRPSTPLNKSVAARVMSSISTAARFSRPLLTVTTPVQSSKITNFKRSSALKPASQKVQNGASPLTIQSPPSSSKAKDSENVHRAQPVPDRIQPRPFRRRRTPNLGVCTTGEVQSVSHDHTIPDKKENTEVMVEHQAPAAEFPEVGTGGWKIHEIDRRPVDKPFSLLQKFKESNEIPVVHPSRDSNAVMRSEPSNAKTTKESDAALSPDGLKEVKPGSDFAPLVSSTPKCTDKRTPGKRPKAALQNGHGGYPSKSSSRKAILLDTPIRVESPIKGPKGRKRRGELSQPIEGNCDSVAGAPPGPGSVREGTETLKSSRTAAKTRVSPGRQSEELLSNHQSKSISRPSRIAESRRSRRTSCDEHLKPQRRKSRSCHHSPEASPGRSADHRKSSETDRRFRESAGRKSPCKSHQRSKSHSRHHRSPERSPARSNRVKSSEAHPTDTDRKLRQRSPETASRVSNVESNQRSESSLERSPAGKSDKVRPAAASPQSTKEQSRPCPESGGKTSGKSILRPSKFDHGITQPGSSSEKTQSKTLQPPQTPSAQSNSGPCPNSAVSPTTLQAAPPKIIRLNRRPANFGAFTTAATRIVLSLGKRPAMFSST